MSVISGGLAYFLPAAVTAWNITSQVVPVPSPSPAEILFSPSPSASSVTPGAFTVLLLGSDDDSKFSKDHVLTQSMILVRVTPATKTVFSATDAQAFHWTLLAGIRANDLIKWEFIQPNGSVFFSSEGRFNFSGGGCAWEGIPIAGNPAANLPGAWQVRVTYNGAQLLTTNFTIGNNPTPTPTPTQTPTPTPTPPPVPTVGAAVIIDGTDANDHGSASGGKNTRGWLYMQKALESLSLLVSPGTAKVVVDLGTTSGGEARRAIDSAFNLSVLKNTGWTLTHVDGAANVTNWLSNLSTNNTGILYLPTYNLTGSDLERDEMDALNAQATRIASFVNRGSGNGGGLFAMGETNASNETRAWGWLRALFPGLNFEDEAAGTDLALTPEGIAVFPGLNDPDLDLKSGEYWHNHFTGNLGTLKVLATAPDKNKVTRNIIIGGIGVVIGPPPPTPTPTPTPGGNRLLRVACGSARPGGTLTLPLEIVAQGDENALGCSLTFDPNVLSNPQVARGSDAGSANLNTNISQLGAGRLGLALALSSGQSFAAGTRQFALVTFNVAANTMNNSTYVEFGDAPIRRQVANANAQSLNADYQGCNNVRIEITTGYEADVTPRPNGKNDGSIAITDWVMVGRFAAGLDAPNAGSEFQRADCAPRDGKGDGQMGIVDWVQAGRYAAGLDAPQTAGGPSAASVVEPIETAALSVAAEASAHARHLRIVGATVQRGQAFDAVVEIEAEGDENAFGFSLAFDPATLRYESATADSGLGNPQLNLNSAQAANGRVGFALGLAAGTSLPAGQRVLLTVRFTALASGTATTTMLAFGDQPIRRQLSDANANALAAEYENAAVAISEANAGNRIANVSAASYQPLAAAETMMAAFGNGLATTVNIAAQLPLPTTLAGTTVKVRDSAGVERFAPLFFVSPNQINYLMPAATAMGAATVTITSGNGTSGNGTTATGALTVTNTAPGLFAANANGQGLAAALALRIKADGTLSYEPVADYDAALRRFVPRPLDLGAANEQVFLILFGTGLRNLRNLSAASAAFAEIGASVLYAGAQGSLAGLDQVNVAVPRALAGRGLVNFTLTVEGVAANSVQVQLK